MAARRESVKTRRLARLGEKDHLQPEESRWETLRRQFSRRRAAWRQEGEREEEGTARTDILKTGVITRQYKALNGALNVDNRSGKEPGRRCSSCSECLVWLLGLFTKSEVGWTGISKRD